VVKRLFDLLFVGFVSRLIGVGWLIEIFAVIVLLFGTGSCVMVCQETACHAPEGRTDCVSSRNVVTKQPAQLNYVTAATSDLSWFTYLWLRG
jgi:hypothetical protein